MLLLHQHAILFLLEVLPLLLRHWGPHGLLLLLNTRSRRLTTVLSPGPRLFLLLLLLQLLLLLLQLQLLLLLLEKLLLLLFPFSFPFPF